MKVQRIATAAFASLLALTPAHRVMADGGDFAAGLISGIIGSAIVNDANRRAQPQRSQTRRASNPKPTISSAQREQNRSVQTALNYFSFAAGAPDGSLGPRSRAAIGEYQAFLGYPVTGQLTDYEREYLLGSYYRAQSGGMETARLITQGGQGVRGLLVAYRGGQPGGATTMAGSYGGLPPEVSAAVDEIARNSDVTAEQLIQRSGFIQLADMNGDGRTDYLLDTSFAGSAFWCNAASCAVRVFASTPEGYERNDFQAFNSSPAMFSCQRGACTMMASDVPRDVAPVVSGLTGVIEASEGSQSVPTTRTVVATAQQEGDSAALPTFLGNADGVRVALSSHCNKVQLMTTQNGGHLSAETLVDAGFVLDEQFCYARSLSVAAGDELAAQVQGFTPQQIAEQCLGFGPVLEPYVAALSVKPRDAVLQDVSGFVLASGMAPAQLAGTARICLGAGYAADDMNVAIGSALVMTALGEAGYAELVGHHLSQGFGVSLRPDLALDWYDTGLSAPTAVFSTGRQDRQDLIRKAAYAVGGRTTQPAVEPASGIPSFGVTTVSTP